MSTVFDSNAWYQITETRVDFNSSMQLSGTELFFGGQSDKAQQYWQLLPVGNGQFAIRNQNFGVNKQLSACFDAKEKDPSRTKPCMVDSDSSTAQKWTVTEWGDGTWKIQNVDNGTGYNLDWHPGNPGFLTATTAAEPRQPAQHWLFSSRKAINDGAFSTTFVSQSRPAATATTTGSSSSKTSSSNPATTSAASHSSTGTAVGAGVGVAVGVILLACLGVFFFLRRRRQKQRPHHPGELDSHTAPPSYGAAPSEAKKEHPVLPHEVYTPPAELPASNAVGPYELHAPHKPPN